MRAISAVEGSSQSGFRAADSAPSPMASRQTSLSNKMGRRLPPTGLSLPSAPPNGFFDAGAATIASDSGPISARPVLNGNDAGNSPMTSVPPNGSLSGSNSQADGPGRLGGLALPSAASQQPNPWQTMLMPQTAAASSVGAPDYFASVHVPDPNGAVPGSTRIASPFALPAGSSVASGTAADAGPSEAHPWAALFGDSGGMKTAFPENGFLKNAAGPTILIPPTPAANSASVPQKGPSPGTMAQLLRMPSSRSKLAPGGAPLNLSGMSRSNSGSVSSASAALSRNSSRPGSSEDTSRFKALNVEALAAALSPPKPAANGRPATAEDVLVLDIRPSTSFHAARVRSSINICAPSTLLKRPGVTVERIEQDMLSSNRERKRFMRWRKGPQRSEQADPENPSSRKAATMQISNEIGINKIIVLDTDTANVGDAGNATAGGGGPCLVGMLKKFEMAGYAGELCWFQGGFNRLISTALGKTLIESGQSEQANDADEDDRSSQVFAEKTPRGSPIETSSRLDASPARPASFDSARKGSLVRPRGLPMEAFQAQSTVTGWPGLPQAEAGATKDGGQNVQAGDAQSGVQPARAAEKTTCANPFFDNIRQNRELAHGITEKIPMELPELSEQQVQALPRFLRELIEKPDEERATVLAQAFFEVEKAEQQRLIATMQQHAAESGQDPRLKGRSGNDHSLEPLTGVLDGLPAPGPLSPSAAVGDPSSDSTQQDHMFPFSISAALERGADNRYNNIWTYEHSRVKLTKPQLRNDPGSDYLNGSFVAPAQRFGCRRKYIATQAPLPSTFEAFWTAIWEQNSRVIVMLTREHESGRIQSHAYWNEAAFGANIRVEKFEEVVLNEHGKVMGAEESRSILQPDSSGGGLFPSMAASQPDSSASGTPTTIRRRFRLRNLAEPASPVRRITQLQYIAWPDYHIPDSPDSLLDLVDAADDLQHEADLEIKQSVISSGQSASLADAHAGPMVVHCSAGVGRTGAFIVIDSALDVLRRCRQRGQSRSSESKRELATWENRPVKAGQSPTVIDIDMPLATPSRRRSTRRSLKRELSPAGMDVDGKPDELHRDVSSPPPTLRTRSNEGSIHQDAAHDLGQWSAANSPPVGTPSRAFGSLQIASSASPGFVNPFSSKQGPSSSSFHIELPESALGSSENGLGGVSRDKGPSRFLFGAASNGTSLGQSPLVGSDHYRSQQAASSPFSEASTPSFPTGRSGSARSSFSSTSANERRPSQLLRSASSNSQGSVDTSLSGSLPAATASSLASRRTSVESLNRMSEGLNPFEAAMGSSAASQQEDPGALPSQPQTHSNEPTPFPRYEARSALGSSGGGAGGSTTGVETTPTSRLTTPFSSTRSANPGNRASVATAAGQAADQALETGEDLIRKTVDTAREQRMSLIQTCRQFVFVYSAVLVGLLRDLKADGIV